MGVRLPTNLLSGSDMARAARILEDEQEARTKASDWEQSSTLRPERTLAMAKVDNTSPEARLRKALTEHHLHQSRQRLGLYEYLLAAEKPLTIDDLHWLALKRKIVSTHTIRQTVRILVDFGFVREIQILKFGSSRQREVENVPKCPCCESSLLMFVQHGHRWSCGHCHARGKLEWRYAALKQPSTKAA